MAKLDLASSEWCQLIFEGKNQAYGAYRMRANSTKRHNVAMLIVVIIAAVGLASLHCLSWQLRSRKK